MSVSRGLDVFKAKPTPDISLAKNTIDDSFTSKLAYSASYSEIEKPAMLKKNTKTFNPYEEHITINHDSQFSPKKKESKLITNAPKVSQRLPSPFGSTFGKSPLPPKKATALLKPLNTDEGLFDVIDNMVNMHQYKNAKELLSPLKKRRIPRETEETEEGNSSKRAQSGRRGKNPLIPLKNYMLMTKMNEGVFKSDDFFKQNLEKVYKTHQGSYSFLPKFRQPESLNLTEMITLGTLKPSYGSGVVKKMLHAPTLKLYTVKEVPINSKESRQTLKIWLGDWQTNLQGSKYNLKLFDTYFNTPEGCLTIISEFMTGGSLQNLLDSMVTIPEKALKSIALQTLLGLNEVHDNMKAVFGSLTPSQILFDKQGNIKLSLGLRSKLFSSVATHQRGKSLSDKTIGSNSGDIGSLFKRKSKISSINPTSDIKFQEGRTQDIFDYGYLMLICAVGGLDFFEASDFTSKLKALLADLEKKPQERQKYCCIIHDEDLIYSIKLKNEEDDVFQKRPVKVHRNNGFTIDKSAKAMPALGIKEFLTCNHFSKEFLDFLCSCLKFDPLKRTNAAGLFNSEFLMDKPSKGPKVSLGDLIKISSQWTHNGTLKPEHQGLSEIQLRKLCDALSIVLPNSHQNAIQEGKPSKVELLKRLNPKSQRLRDLSHELGLPVVKVWDSISAVIQGITEKPIG